MGYGQFVESPGGGAPHGLDLLVSFQYDAVAAGHIDEWRRVFQWASGVLDEATDGQIRIRRVRFYNDKLDQAKCDVWLFDSNITATTTAGTNIGFGTPLHIQAGTETWVRPGILVHELSHYAFALGDEYGTALCIDPNADPFPGFADGACIMQRSADGLMRTVVGDVVQWPDSTVFPVITQFCTGGNHGPGTLQGPLSCWDTIVANTPLATADIDATKTDTSVPPVAAAVTWLDGGQATPRFALILDKSGSMGAGNAIAGVRFAAEFWIDLELFLGSRLAVIPYANVPLVPPQAFDLAAIDSVATADDAKAVVAPLTHGGTTNITGALLAGQAQLNAGTDTIRNTMILFSDGRHNVGGEPTAAQYKAIRNDDIRVFTVGFGPNVQETLLKKIAQETNGDYVKIQPWGAAAEQQVQSELAEIAATTHSGPIASERVVLPEPPFDGLPTLDRPGEPYSKEDLEFIQAVGFLDSEPSAGVDIPAEVEEGAARATFVMTRPADLEAQLYLLRPDRSIVDPADVEFRVGENGPHVIYVVTAPEPGRWTMRAVREAPRLELPLALFAFCETPGLNVGLTGTRDLYDVRDEVRLGLQVAYPRILTGIDAYISPVVADDSEVERIRFEELLPGQGQYVLAEPLIFDEPGSYEFLLEVANDGTALEARDEQHAMDMGVEVGDPLRPPPFRRLRRFQVHVGPLSEGEDTDGADGEEDLAAS